MKTLRIIVLILAIPAMGYSQIYVDGVLIDTLNIPYCQLICVNANGLSRTRVTIDYGQPFVNTAFNRQKVAGADRNVITFNSSIDALNFMIKHGWTLVSSTVIGTESGNYGTFIYLLKGRASFILRPD